MDGDKYALPYSLSGFVFFCFAFGSKLMKFCSLAFGEIGSSSLDLGRDSRFTAVT